MTKKTTKYTSSWRQLMIKWLNILIVDDNEWLQLLNNWPDNSNKWLRKLLNVLPSWRIRTINKWLNFFNHKFNRVINV